MRAQTYPRKLRGVQMVKGHKVCFRWVPSHSKVEGNGTADALARLTPTNEMVTPPPHTLVTSCRLNEVKRLSREHWGNMYPVAKGGRNTRELDKALPGMHPKAIPLICRYDSHVFWPDRVISLTQIKGYDNLTRLNATVLAQM